MKKIVLAGIAAATILSASAGFAADLPRRNQPSSPVYTPPVFTWTGFYLGVNGGAGFGKFSGLGKTNFGNANGGLIGATAGYNYQFNQFVAGIEGDADFARMDGSSSYNKVGGTISGKGRLSSLFTLRGRLGYSVDRALLFVTGGYAGGNVKGNLTDTSIATSYSQSNYLNGYVLGAGLEYAFTNNISAKAEYLYTSLGSKNYFSGINVTNAGLRESIIRAGVNYRF